METKWVSIRNSKAVGVLNRFADSPAFIAAVAAIVFIGHVTGCDLLGAYAIVLPAAALFVFHDDSLAPLSLVLFTPCAISRQNAPNRNMAENPYYTSPAVLPQLLFLLAVLAAAFVFRLVVYNEYRRLLRRGRLTVSFLVVSAVLLAGGIFSVNQGFDNVGYGAMVAASMFLPYLYLLNTADFKRERALPYFMAVMTIFGLVCAASIANVYVVDPAVRALDAPKSLIQIGWSGPNSTGTLLAMTMPASLFLAVRSKRPEGWFVAALCNMCALLFTYSRAALVVGLPVYIVIVVYACFRAANKRSVRICAIAAAVLILILGLSLQDRFVRVFAFFFENKLDDSGRFDLIRSGWDAFRHSPVFGVGQTFLLKEGHWFFSFHNTICHYLFTCGVVGLAAYLYHRFRTIQLLFVRLTRERLFLFASLFVLVINGLLDICMVNGIPLMLYGVMLAFAEADSRKTDRAAKVSLDREGPAAEVAQAPEVAGGASAPAAEANTKPAD